MMQVSSILDVHKMEADLPILAVKVKLKNIYKPRTSKPNAPKPYHFQDVIGTDGTNEIKIVLADRDELPQALKGKWVYFQCFKSEKHGWVGVKSNDNVYEGKTTRQIWVTKTAIIETAEEFDGKQTGKPLQKQQPAPAATAAPTTRQPATPMSEAARSEVPPQQPATQQENGGKKIDEMLVYAEAIVKAKRFIGQRAIFEALAFWGASRAEKLIKELDTEDVLGDEWTLSEEHYQAIQSSIFISADRASVIDTLPYDGIQKYLEYAKMKKEEYAKRTAAAK